MKTDKKSLVPLFTFPPPLLAALFLLAGCHYKALQGMVWAIGVGHRARWRSPMFQTPWHAHTLSHTHTHTLSLQNKPHRQPLAHGCAHMHSREDTHTRLYMCALQSHTRNHKHWTYVYTVHTHVSMHSTLTNIWGQTHNTHTNYIKEHAYEHAHMRARTLPHVHTGSRRNTGTHRKSSKVIQCRKLVHTSEQHSTGVVA